MVFLKFLLNISTFLFSLFPCIGKGKRNAYAYIFLLERIFAAYIQVSKIFHVYSITLMGSERCHNGCIYKKKDGHKLEKKNRNDSDFGCVIGSHS